MFTAILKLKGNSSKQPTVWVEPELTLFEQWFVTCPVCGTDNDVPNYQHGAEIECIHCGTILTLDVDGGSYAYAD